MAATSYSSGVYVWDLENPGPPVRTPTFGVSSAMFNESGTQLLTCLDQGIQIWDFVETANGPELKEPRLLECAVGSSRRLTHTFASDRAVIISSSQAVWKFSTSDFSNPEKLPSRFEQSAAISPNGRWLAIRSLPQPLFVVPYPSCEAGSWQPRWHRYDDSETAKPWSNLRAVLPP